MNEFDFIATHLAPLAGAEGLALKDDAALITPPAGKQLVITKDAMVADVHFFANDPADDIARKLMRVNLSDLAAKGATPYGYFLAMMLPPSIDEAWLKQFCDGLAQDQNQFDFTLLGGDTTRTKAELALSLTALGWVDKGQMLQRSGAQIGDDLYVSGTIGDAALHIAGQNARADNFLHQRYLLPQPRVALGAKLQNIATASLDVSDGLVADAAHLAEASNIALEIDAEAIPLSTAAQNALKKDVSLLQDILTGGDDYELLFTLPAAKKAELHAIAQKTETPITRVGKVKKGQGVTVLDADRKCLSLEKSGWTHF